MDDNNATWRDMSSNTIKVDDTPPDYHIQHAKCWTSSDDRRDK